MVSQDQHLDSVFHALADPTRRAMLRRLADARLNIGELAAPFDMSFPAASKHLRVLETAGLVNRTVEGRTHVFQIEPARLALANRWISYYERLWNQQLDALEAMIDDENRARSKRRKRTP